MPRARCSATSATGGCGGWREGRARGGRVGHAARAGGVRQVACHAHAALRAPAARAAPACPDRRHDRVPEALRSRWPVDPHHQRRGRRLRRPDQSPLPQQGRTGRRRLPALQQRAGGGHAGRGGARRGLAARAHARLPRVLLRAAQPGRRRARGVGGVLGPVPALAGSSSVSTTRPIRATCGCCAPCWRTCCRGAGRVPAASI